MQVDKRTIIDAIIGGVKIPHGGINKTLTPFCGNQHNEDWEWSRSELEKMSYDALVQFYNTRRKAKEE